LYKISRILKNRENKYFFKNYKNIVSMKNILVIQRKLRSIDKKLYIVWGFCRDKILDKKINWDVDIVTDATPDEMKQVLKIVWEVGKKYGTCIVSEWGEVFELTTFRKDIW